MVIDDFCQICGIEIKNEVCCNGDGCGCLGLPIHPPVCSNQECYNKYETNRKEKQFMKLKKWIKNEKNKK